MKRKFWLIALAAALVLVGGTAAALRVWYSNNLKPVSSSVETAFFTVSPGSGVHQIAFDLKSNGLIRSTNAFETYVTTNNYRGKLQAGTYRLSPSMGVRSIVAKMISGDVAKDLLTILPGKRLDQIKKAFIEAGYPKTEVNKAFSPANYAGHPALASLPKNTSLEGYLYPDSFQKQTNTPATTIVRQSLDEMARYLTPDVIGRFKAQNLGVFEGITLASIVLKETDNPSDQPTVAQVLLTRLARGIALQADATAFYATDIAGLPHSLKINSPYNTYLQTGLPPGPISNVTKEALLAVANPAKTDFLFYVTGDDGKTRFSRTVQEHEAAVQKYCKQRCAL
ncbi:endolytic transglycosylase MltG [Candidatus Saccharibacteria bacterium]|nr:endolytic transglycosylase MltG [Candidatus Saccharibacteria bacterium]